MQKGQRESLSDYVNVNRKFKVMFAVEGNLNCRPVCFALDADGNLPDIDYVLLTDDNEENSNRAFTIMLAELPEIIEKLSFCISIDDVGAVKNLKRCKIIFLQDNDPRLMLDISGKDFAWENVLLPFEIVWDSGWQIDFVNSGYTAGLYELLKNRGLSDKSILKLKRLYENNIVNKMLEKGVKEYENKNYNLAVKIFKEAVDKGSIEAMAYLGICAYFGRGVNKDYSIAYECFKMAAEEHDVLAQSWLGLLYERGEGVDKNYAEAFKWYKKSAKFKNAFSQYKVGRFYYDGTAGEKNLGKAKHWLEKSADYGHKYAAELLKKLNSEYAFPAEDDAESDYDEDDVNFWLEKLNNMIGLSAIKEEVATLVNLAKLNKIRKGKGANVVKPSYHLVFSGNPGTGKTTVARIIAEVYKALGILSKGQLIEVDRSQLVAGYIGQTAIKTSDKIKEAAGGVLFIDEAYSLTVGQAQGDFGQEAVDTILKAMEDRRDDFVVIAAGYPDLMDKFLSSNPGLRSRFGKVIHFDDYTADELTEIFKSMVKENHYTLANETEDAVRLEFTNILNRRAKGFANGRTARSLFETVVSRQANRLAKNPNLAADEAELFLIKEEDLQLIENKNEQGENLDDLLKELNSLIGLSRVKEETTRLINTIKVNKMRREQGLPELSASNHLVFSGNPGTGKTTVARLLAKIYKSLGVLSQGHLVEADRSKLVAGYVGQTAKQVTTLVEHALGGVLFIDEAYSLTAGKSHEDFGFEAVDALLKEMEDHRRDLVVIVAGYPNLMEEFLSANPGLRSRFNTFIHFEDYSPAEMTAIFKSMATAQNYSLEKGAIERLRKFFDAKFTNPPPDFANGRTVRNFFEKTIANQGDRLANSQNVTKEDLLLIKVEDLAV
ncbi:MAG: AAA family ATPase [Selenomonadaceae bacterium]|nr:AAA family ATPase [Selenomonadaceae bacterium]